MEPYQQRMVFDLYSFYRLRNPMTMTKTMNSGSFKQIPQPKLYFLVFVACRHYTSATVLNIWSCFDISNTTQSAACTLDPTSTCIFEIISLRFFYGLHLHILFVIVTQTVRLYTDTAWAQSNKANSYSMCARVCVAVRQYVNLPLCVRVRVCLYVAGEGRSSRTSAHAA